MKTCYTCHIAQPTSEYNKDSSKRDRLSLYCKSCAKTRQLKYIKPKKPRIPKLKVVEAPTEVITKDELRSIAILKSYYEDLAELNNRFTPFDPSIYEVE